jgi:hypothetical protein
MKPIDKARRLILAAKNSAKSGEGFDRINAVSLFSRYVEPGEDAPASGVIALGNWNDITLYSREKNEIKVIDNTPDRLRNAFEKIGVALEWSDEWEACGRCKGIFRIEASGPSWRPSYSNAGGRRRCRNCVNPKTHLRALEGLSSNANSLFDPEEHGYILVPVDFERGFHRGQDADTAKIAGVARSAGVKRFLFNWDSSGQFDVSFSLWVHKNERRKINGLAKLLAGGAGNGPSVSEGIMKALKTAPVPDGQGVLWTQCYADGTSESRRVSPEELIRGIKRKETP